MTYNYEGELPYIEQEGRILKQLAKIPIGKPVCIVPFDFIAFPKKLAFQNLGIPSLEEVLVRDKNIKSYNSSPNLTIQPPEFNFEGDYEEATKLWLKAERQFRERTNSIAKLNLRKPSLETIELSSDIHPLFFYNEGNDFHLIGGKFEEHTDLVVGINGRRFMLESEFYTPCILGSSAWRLNIEGRVETFSNIGVYHKRISRLCETVDELMQRISVRKSTIGDENLEVQNRGNLRTYSETLKPLATKFFSSYQEN